MLCFQRKGKWHRPFKMKFLRVVFPPVPGVKIDRFIILHGL